MPIAEALKSPFYQELEGKADPTKTAVSYFRKYATKNGLEAWPERAPSTEAALKRCAELGRAAQKEGWLPHVFRDTSLSSGIGACQAPG